MNGIKYIQDHLKQNNIDAYLVFTSDDHGSEYVVDRFKTREYLSGFTGSAGTLVITQKSARLWTDGRYFLQAEQELSGKDITLMKQGQEGVLSIFEYIKTLTKTPVVAFDFSVATIAFVEELKNRIPSVKLLDESEIIEEVWKDRPAYPKTSAFVLSDEIVGESCKEKIERLKKDIEKQGAKYALLCALDDIAWLYNLRGNDIEYNPVNYAFSLVSNSEKIVYIDREKISLEVKAYLEKNGVKIRDYFDVYEEVSNLNGIVLVDKEKTNYSLYNAIKEKKAVEIFPTSEYKAVKNAVEIKNSIKAHILDGVAMVNFAYWLKNAVGKEALTELSVSNRLHEFRKENEEFMELSFETICGCKEHGAIVHYAATENTDKRVDNSGFLLVDSGAHYTCGTTDITRTFVLGKLTKEEKEHFTLVLKGHIRLAKAKFLKGTRGLALDLLARSPLFERGLDYRHGTGHGVGYLLNVHEGPQRISCGKNTETLYPIKPGMITSDEPGVYIAGKYGIRHESLLLCVEQETNEYGAFLGFKPLTLVPFDREGIVKELLTNDEIDWLNAYHLKIRDTLSPYLTDEVRVFLFERTNEL